jgi:hypothetical protein
LQFVDQVLTKIEIDEIKISMRWSVDLKNRYEKLIKSKFSIETRQLSLQGSAIHGQQEGRVK